MTPTHAEAEGHANQVFAELNDGKETFPRNAAMCLGILRAYVAYLPEPDRQRIEPSLKVLGFAIQELALLRAHVRREYRNEGQQLTRELALAMMRSVWETTLAVKETCGTDLSPGGFVR